MTKDLYAERIFKKSQNSKKTNNPMMQCAKDLNVNFTKGNTQMASKHM